MGKQEIAFKGHVDPTRAIVYLEELVAGFREGRIYLQHGSDHLSFQPAESISLELEAKRKDGKEKIAMGEKL